MRVGIETLTGTGIAGVGSHSRARSIVSIACGVYAVGYAGYHLSGPFEALRYLIYALPLLLIASSMQDRVSSWSRPAAAFLFAYVALAVVSYLTGTRDVAFASRNFVIIACAILCFMPVVEVNAAQIRFIFLCSLVYLFMDYWGAERGEIRLLQMLNNGTGTAVVEGYDSNDGGGVVGPLYAAFFFAIGAKLQFLLALIMSIVAGKRVAILAIVVGVCAAMLFRYVPALKQRRNCFFALLAALATINIVATNLDTISEYVFHSASITVSFDEVMLGRYAIAIELNRMMDTRPFVESLFGSGPGGADTLASIVSSGVLTQPHNDWMKILHDYGIAGSIVMTTFMALLFSTSATAAVIAITTAIIMSTDNVLIYLFYWFPAALMVAYSQVQEPAARRTPW
ncbi:O-antigen ligase family protein [Bradyrhizobium tropiciagri]|uniref:O-antigen ligase family protein n=1 Tax=Bradyrhizobium tropiciagri TaxID=312253 RepID=UPI001BA8318E|nr:O-antigen ligase family protein [Bradyrhizobium tropiciagri]MBR0874906.1 O-antigen ligase family protein [Bradyrhizobium tropiciagri]